jgi:Putative addiction module component
MSSLEQLTEYALSLPSVLKVRLIERLIESLEFGIDPELQALWMDTAKRRRDEVRGSKIQPISGEEALDLIRQMLGR